MAYIFIYYMCVIQQDKLGQVKTTVYDLPDKGFTYGRANEKRTYTAADGKFVS